MYAKRIQYSCAINFAFIKCLQNLIFTDFFSFLCIFSVLIIKKGLTLHEYILAIHVDPL